MTIEDTLMAETVLSERENFLVGNPGSKFYRLPSGKIVKCGTVHHGDLVVRFKDDTGLEDTGSPLENSRKFMAFTNMISVSKDVNETMTEFPAFSIIKHPTVPQLNRIKKYEMDGYTIGYDILRGHDWIFGRGYASLVKELEIGFQ